MPATCNYVIASGEDFPDGLALPVYSRPILLTRADSLAAETKAELDRLVGTVATPGPCAGAGRQHHRRRWAGVISSHRRKSWTRTARPHESPGANRYATALAVAKNRIPVEEPTPAIIATGANFPDALAGGVLAQDKGAPILLNDGDTVSS